MRIIPSDYSPMDILQTKVAAWSQENRYIIARIANVASPVFAILSVAYHGIGLMKTPVILLKGLIYLIPTGRGEGGKCIPLGRRFPEGFEWKAPFIHAYKVVLFCVDIVVCPVVGFLSPTINVKLHVALGLTKLPNPSVPAPQAPNQAQLQPANLIPVDPAAPPLLSVTIQAEVERAKEEADARREKEAAAKPQSTVAEPKALSPQEIAAAAAAARAQPAVAEESDDEEEVEGEGGEEGAQEPIAQTSENENRPATALDRLRGKSRYKPPVKKELKIVDPKAVGPLQLPSEDDALKRAAFLAKQARMQAAADLSATARSWDGEDDGSKPKLKAAVAAAAAPVPASHVAAKPAQSQ